MNARGCVLFAILLAACHRGNAGGAQPPGAGPRAVPVQVTTLKLQPVEESSDYLATLTSRRSIAVHPQVTGPITRIFVQPGQRVTQGQPLMEVNPQRDQATLANLRALRSQREAAVHLAEQNFARAQKLVGPGIVSKQDYETAKSALSSARADLQAAQAQIAAQQTQLQYDRVSAPFAGIVGDIPVKVGDAVTTATTLTTLDESAKLQAYVHVPLGRAAALTPTSKVQLLDDQGHVVAEQQVGFVSPQADPATQTLLLRIDFPNTQSLRASQLVRARVIWSTHPGLLLPANAVLRLSGATFAYAVAHGDGGGLIAEQVPVKLGDLHGNDYEALDGLQPGQQVVVSGIQNLRPGASIVPEQPQPRVGRPAPGAAPAGGRPMK